MIIKKYIILALTALLFAGCTNDDDFNKSSDTDRLPLAFNVSLTGDRPVTRAIDNKFSSDDELLCYVRHIYSTDLSTDNNYTVVDEYKKLVTFEYGSSINLFWDDFSESTDDGKKDLRTENHALQSFYGYCYNGGKPSTDLVEATGVLGWTTAADQTADGEMKKNDLLWSNAQTPTTYQHAKDEHGTHGTLNVPFTHAMSKFTIVVVADNGFAEGNLENTTVTLKEMSEKGTFTAPTGEISVTGTTGVKMYSDATDAATAKTRTYEAVVVPLTELTEGKVLAQIENVAGNNYDIKITKEILGTSDPIETNNWSAGIKDGKSQNGVNYKLTITVKKQGISVVATLDDWHYVSATGTGEIKFDADVTNINQANDDNLKDGDSFSLWMTTDLDKLGDIATTAKYDGSKFVNSPAIYWPNGFTSYYFRALAKKTTEHTLEAVTTTSVTQGTDLLWGTTAAHTGTEADGSTTHDYTEGAAINPRTGDVPMLFKHTMSNVVINLTTSDDDSKVILTDATVTLTNLTTSGKVDIATGVVTPGSTLAAKAVDGATVFNNLIMVPQTITDDARLIITTNGTTYSLQLNKCVDTDDNDVLIKNWTSGSRYTYTINLKKEEVSFRALVQDWTPNTGSGNATLDWD